MNDKSCMSPSTHKILAIDLDGTLLSSQKEISSRSVCALLEAQRHGHRIVLATGRPAHGALPFVRQLQLAENHGFLLCYNGAAIIQCEGDKFLYKNYIPPVYLPKIYASCSEAGFPVMTYDGDSILTENVEDQYIQHAARINRMEIHRTPDFRKICSPVPKCIITGEPDQLPRMERKMQAEFGGELSVIRSETYFLEVMNRGVVKGTTLAILLDMIGEKPKDLVSFGDSYNDASMLRQAGWSVAMGNARPEIQAIANEVTASNDEDGVAKVVERMLL